MKRFVLFATLSLVLVLAVSALADPTTKQYMARGDFSTLHGGVVNAAKADGDTVYVLGGPDSLEGKFEDSLGNPNWNGWTHYDNTFSEDEYWHVATEFAVNGVYSAWCGSYFDGDPGYGNDWNQNYVFEYEVDDNSVASSVTWSGSFQCDSEPGWDFTHIEINRGGSWENLASYDGNRLYSLNETFTYQPDDYVGSSANMIRLRIRFASDGNTSDEDDLYLSDGAVQADDISVSINGTVVDFEDFEGGPEDPSILWFSDPDPGVGDYAELYMNLQDADPCRSNYSAQVAFIDDGIVVPGTGGTPCVSWCYGPGGFIVNVNGGLMGPDYHIHNFLVSPAKEWPAGSDAAYIIFDVYRHEELGAYSTWPGMFYQWYVRSTADPLTEPIETRAWQNRNLVQYGGPDYLRQQQVVTDLLENGRVEVQMALTCYEYGYTWDWVGTDGTPAPYFDNCAIVAYPYAGPGMSTREIDIAQDNFPVAGDFDLVNLENNLVRFDMANNISQADHLLNDPGDSITFDISAVRAGSVLNDMPKMFVRMKANDLFDAVRILPANFTQTDNIIEGWVYGDSTFTANGSYVADRFNFDLPDEPGDNFFFPGDVIHYYIEAQDNLMGDIGTSLMPADTTGYASFNHNLTFSSSYIVRALPTMFSATAEDQPEILLWNDFGNRGGENEWLFALQQNGYIEGQNYDLYYTNAPSSSLGNGLGGRATSALLSGYNTLLYTCGDLSTTLLSNGDFNNDAGKDIEVVTNWFGRGDKNAFFTGDDFVTGMNDAGADGSAFINTYCSVNYIDKSILSYIGNQTAPKVVPIAGNGVIARVDEWIAYGGCIGVNTFDAIEPIAGSSRIAEFTDQNGNAGAYTYAAGIYNVYGPENARVVMMPYDLMFLYNAPGWTPPAEAVGLSARAIILGDILNFFGNSTVLPPVGVTPDAKLTVGNYPNPFNPKTTFEMNLPKSGQVTLKVFNVRGELVRTLVDGTLAAGPHSIEWDGKSDQGSQAASGVYFSETRAGGQVKINKMALVK